MILANFPKSKINEVTSAITDHIGLWRDEPLTNLHSQILWDADKLSKLGLTFVFHLIGMTVTSERPTPTRELIMTARDANWQEKLLQSLHTAPAKRAARSRLASYRSFWQNLEWELDGSDLADN